MKTAPEAIFLESKGSVLVQRSHNRKQRSISGNPLAVVNNP